MKRSLIAGATITLAVVAIASYLWAPDSVPRNQKPLVKLTAANLAQFQAAFDASESLPRVVLLLSPT